MYTPTNPKLSIITLTVKSRVRRLATLSAIIHNQIECLSEPLLVEHVCVPDEVSDESYGEKMRRSLTIARGDYVCWLDDDDMVSGNYVAKLFEYVTADPTTDPPNQTPDVVTFQSLRLDTGETWDLRLRSNDWVDVAGHMYMSANHYCVWRREIANKSPWLPRQYGSEVVWYTCLRYAFPDLLEYRIPLTLHLYRYDPLDTLCQRPNDVEQSKIELAGGVECYKDVDGNVLASLKGEAVIRDDDMVSVIDARGKVYSRSRKELGPAMCVVKLWPDTESPNDDTEATARPV